MFNTNTNTDIETYMYNISQYNSLENIFCVDFKDNLYFKYLSFNIASFI